MSLFIKLKSILPMPLETTDEHLVPSTAVSQRTVVGGKTTEPTYINGTTVLPTDVNIKVKPLGPIEFNLIEAICNSGDRSIKDREDELNKLKLRQAVVEAEIATYKKLLVVAKEHVTI